MPLCKTRVCSRAWSVYIIMTETISWYISVPFGVIKNAFDIIGTKSRLSWNTKIQPSSIIKYIYDWRRGCLWYCALSYCQKSALDQENSKTIFCQSLPKESKIIYCFLVSPKLLGWLVCFVFPDKRCVLYPCQTWCVNIYNYL